MSDLKGLSDSEKILSKPVWKCQSDSSDYACNCGKFFVRWCIVKRWGENAIDELVR